MKTLILVLLFVMFLAMGCSMVAETRRSSLYPECSSETNQADAYACMNQIIEKEGHLRGSTFDRFLTGGAWGVFHEKTPTGEIKKEE